jgi:hypothetical protein
MKVFRLEFFAVQKFHAITIDHQDKIISQVVTPFFFP